MALNNPDDLKNEVILGDNLEILKGIPSESIDMIYVDPPFNTGKRQKGSKDKGSKAFYEDRFNDYKAFITPRIEQCKRILKDTGTIYVHLDYRETHHCRFVLDEVFGEENFLNEIIWAYDFGGRSKRKWSSKHDNILMYVKDPLYYYFDFKSMERIPYMAPGLCGPEKAARGKVPTSVMWHTIVHTTGKERTGYPTQKPVNLIKRFVKVSCPPNGLCLDFFAGSGTLGQACIDTDRKFILVDNNPDAIDVMRQRFEKYKGSKSEVRFPEQTFKINDWVLEKG